MREELKLFGEFKDTVYRTNSKISSLVTFIFILFLFDKCMLQLTCNPVKAICWKLKTIFFLFFVLLLELSIQIKALICSKTFHKLGQALPGLLPLILIMRVLNSFSNVVMSIYERLQCAHEKSK